jgi:site-specific DNA-methyltransferase (adenine-specific)
MKEPKSEVYNIDCMEYMKNIPDKYFDLAIVDPPYGIGQPKQANLKGYKGRQSLEDRLYKNRLNNGSGKLKDRVLNTSNCDWDNKIPSNEYFIELFRVSKNQIIWGGNYFPLPPSRCILCWDKIQPWENFSQIELAWTSFDSPAQIFKYDNKTGDKIHPTQKPISLYAWLLNKYAKPGDKILDTHLGSGSSRIAAYKLGFDFVGCELDKEYFDAQEERFRKECFGEIKTNNGTYVEQDLFK